MNLISSRWIPYDLGNRLSMSFQFAENIRHLKDAIKAWAVDKRLRWDKDLHQIEFELSRIYNMDGGGMGNQVEKDVFVRL